MEQLVEWELTEETGVFGENQPQCHFFHHNSDIELNWIEFIHIPYNPRYKHHHRIWNKSSKVKYKYFTAHFTEPSPQHQSYNILQYTFQLKDKIYKEQDAKNLISVPDLGYSCYVSLYQSSVIKCMNRPGVEPGEQRYEPTANRPSYDTVTWSRIKQH
jgi:hypothetical protein